jgi:hypothetical protein
MKKVAFSTIVNPHQYKLVKAGKSDIVYEFIIPKGYVAFIDQIANSWYPNTYLKFIVDWEEETVQREIAPINSPKEYKPPILAKNFIRWIAFNNDSQDHVFEVLCDGFLARVSEWRLSQ